MLIGAHVSPAGGPANAVAFSHNGTPNLIQGQGAVPPARADDQRRARGPVDRSVERAGM